MLAIKLWFSLAFYYAGVDYGTRDFPARVQVAYRRECKYRAYLVDMLKYILCVRPQPWIGL